MSDTIFDLPMLFDGKSSEELESVTILPLGDNPPGGPFTLPNNLKFSDLESLSGAVKVAGSNAFFNAPEYTKDLLFIGNIISFRGTTTDLSSVRGVDLTIISDTTYSLSLSGASDARLGLLVGHKKKYATTNLSVTLDVNNGNNIAVNTRYGIAASALPASFLKPDGKMKDNVTVKVLVYNNSGSGQAIFADPGFQFVSNQYSEGVAASVTPDGIVVQAGRTQLMGAAINTGNPTGNTLGVSSAPCKVVAILSGEAYTVQTA